jgi:hypothetical protein
MEKKMRKSIGPSAQHLAHVSELTAITDGHKDWSFFDTQEALQEWLDWLDTPASPKVVNLVRERTR